MLKILFRYTFAFFVIAFIGFILFNYIFLPRYVMSGKDYYLPDLRGEYLQKAKHEMLSLGFDVEVTESLFSEDNTPGTIIKMSPRPFTKVKVGRSINLVVAGHRKEFMMPDYKNMSFRNAKIAINKQELILDTTIYEFNETYAKGLISFQHPKPGRIISSGSYITLGISKGSAPDYFYVPDVVGLSLKNGNRAIVNAGLSIGEIIYEYHPKLLNNTILDQNMAPNMKVSIPIKIDLILSKDKD